MGTTRDKLNTYIALGTIETKPINSNEKDIKK